MKLIRIRINTFRQYGVFPLNLSSVIVRVLLLLFNWRGIIMNQLRDYIIISRLLLRSGRSFDLRFARFVITLIIIRVSLLSLCIA